MRACVQAHTLPWQSSASSQGHALPLPAEQQTPDPKTLWYMFCAIAQTAQARLAFSNFFQMCPFLDVMPLLDQQMLHLHTIHNLSMLRLTVGADMLEPCLGQLALHLGPAQPAAVVEEAGHLVPHPWQGAGPQQQGGLAIRPNHSGFGRPGGPSSQALCAISPCQMPGRHTCVVQRWFKSGLTFCLTF